MSKLKAALPFVLAAIPTLIAISWVQSSVAKTTDYEDQIYKACRQIGGPNVGYYIKQDGTTICTNKRGQRLSRQPNIGAFDDFFTF